MSRCIKITAHGGFKKAPAYLKKMNALQIEQILAKYGERGVAALSQATPVDTGRAASSWRYTIESSKGKYSLIFCNDDIENGFPVAIMLQYGHGTGTGGWVEGIDYINPALASVFSNFAEEAWKEVTSI